MKRASDHWISVAILTAAILAMVVVHMVAVVRPFDDAFIIFRYVENFWKGEGAVYNAGERVFGISSPLYATWLALLKGVARGSSLPVLAARGNLVFLVAAGILIYRMLLSLGARPIPASLAGGAVVVSEGILRASIGGMEAPLYVALMAGSLLAVTARRDTVAVLLACLASLARPEGLLLLATIMAVCTLDRGGSTGKRFPLTPLLGLVPLAVWIVAATGYYGTPVPHSIIAKSRPLYPLAAGAALDEILTRAGRWLLDGIHLLGHSFSSGPSADEALRHPMARWLLRFSGAAILVLPLLQWWRLGWPSRRLALPIYFASLVGFYAVTNPLLFLWYLPLIQVPLIVLGVAGGLAPGRPGAWRRLGRGLAPALLLSTALLSFVCHLRPSYWSLIEYGGDNVSRAVQMDSYVRAAEWLRGHSRETETVAATEIGLLGYSLDRRILDSCGLVTPEAIPFLPAPPAQRGIELVVMPVDFVRSTRPDYIVSLPAYIGPSLLANPWFATAYEKAHEIPCLAGNPRFASVLIYRRRP